MIILKIGGSILTKKDSIKSEINQENLNRIANEIKKSLDNSKKDLIIVHGAGSFGHPLAKEYKIGEEFSNEDYPEKRVGFSKTQNKVKELNLLICKTFIDYGLPVIALPPSCFMTANKGRLNSCNLDLVKKYLDEGYIPVLYGDPILDNSSKMVVLSGDQIIQYLASNLEPKMVILGTDVDGVYNKNPKTHSDAAFFDKFSSLEDLDTFEGSTNTDVTGGMFGKIKELLSLADLGIESKIINANKKDNVYKALENENIKGTLISKNNNNNNNNNS